MLAGSDKASLILDAACGIGNITGAYTRDYSIFGIDEQYAAIQFCKQYFSGFYSVGSLYQIPIADNSLDIILFLDAIEHFTKPMRALKELARILKPGGKILICTINYANPLWFILENTWHRFIAADACKTYAKDVHPTRYTKAILQDHCAPYFNEIRFEKHVFNMELFYIGGKTASHNE